MKELKKHQLEYAVTRLVALRNSRGLSQTDLEELSGVKQSTVSKIEHKTQEPSSEILEKLFAAMGQQLANVLSAADQSTKEMYGYFATPLTGLSDIEDAAVRNVVEKVRRCAGAEEFATPSLKIYWPGEHTHPKKDSKLKPSTVYLIDRSRVSTFDFLIILCAAPSFGVGQENEIATQGGVPAIRLIQPSVSRMMRGSFIQSFDVTYQGTLEQGVSFEEEDLREAFRNIVRMHFRHAAHYSSLNGNDFGPRLKKLIDERARDYKTFAEDLGIALSYLQAMMVENIAVSNPSAQLLTRMSVLLRESVGYLLGEKEQHDEIYDESKENWQTWIRESPDLDAKGALETLESWRSEYFARRVESSPISLRNELWPMGKADWDELYQKLAKTARTVSKQKSMFAN